MKLNNLFFPFLFWLLWGCKTQYQVNSSSQNLYEIKDSIREDTVSSIESMLKPYRDSMTGILNEVIGMADGDFHKDKNGGSLGNLITDAMMEEATNNKKCQAAVFNPGGIRLPDVMTGAVTKGKLLELIPFDNELVILEIKGDVLEKWLNVIGSKGGWPIKIILDSEIIEHNTIIEHQIPSTYLRNNKQMDYPRYDTIYAEQVDGSLQRNIIKVDIDKDVIYCIATNDYVANGGDNCDFLKDQKQIKTGLLIRDIVSDYIKKKKHIKPDGTTRIIIKD
jgi:2',3'-cyclic-nucleotide 2'-phosphodiesterase (5'-nucleotidase family)